MIPGVGCAPTTDVSYLSASSASSTSVTLRFPSSIVIILRKTEAQGAFVNPDDYPQDGSTYTTTVGAVATVVSNQGTALSSYTDTVTAGKYFYKVVAKSDTCYADGAVGQTEVSITPGQTGIAWSYGRSGGSMLKIGLAGDGKIYPSSNGGYIVALDITGANAGVESWAPVASTGAQSFQSPMTWVPLSPSPNAVIAADQGGKVYAVNSATGAPLWTEYTTGATAIQAGVAVQLSRYANAAFQTQYGANTDIIFAASNNGAGTITNKLYAIRASDGTCCTAPTWSFNGTVESGTAVAEVTGMPYVDYGRNRIYVATKAAGAAFPVVAAENGGNQNTNSTSHPINLPTGIVSGDLLIVFFTVDGTPTVSGWPSGWNAIFTPVANGTVVKTEGRYKIADGTEGSTFTLTTSALERSAHTSYRITGWHGTTAPEAAAATPATSANPDPPSLSPSWGAESTLWFAVAGYDNGTLTINTTTGIPASYTNGRNDRSNSTAGVGQGVARLQLNATPQNPGTFTISASEQWTAVTVAVRPAPSSSRSLWIINSLTGSSSACSGTDCEMGVLDSSPTLSYAETTLYVGDTAGNLYALENLSGALTRKWTSLTDSRFALGVGNGNLQGYVWEDYTTAGRLYFTTTTGRVMCVQDNGTSASLCALPWPATPTTVATTVYTPLLMDKLFVGGSDGKVHQIDLTGAGAGTVTRSVNIDLTGCSGSPCKVGDVSTLTGNEIFVGSENGKIYKIDLVSGALP